MSQKKKNVKLDDLAPGDIIRALITDEKLPDEKREHCFVVLGYVQPKDPNAKRHRMCVPACSFSSSIPRKENECYVDIEKGVVPVGIFDNETDITLLRLGRPKCVESYQLMGKRGTLIQYSDLWEEVCNKVHTVYGLDMQNFNHVCDCNCLEKNDLNLEYCSQDLYYLSNKKCQDSTAETCKVCSCCGYNFENISCDFEECPVCHDNLYIVFISRDGGMTYLYEDQI